MCCTSLRLLFMFECRMPPASVLLSLFCLAGASAKKMMLSTENTTHVLPYWNECVSEKLAPEWTDELNEILLEIELLETEFMGLEKCFYCTGMLKILEWCNLLNLSIWFIRIFIENPELKASLKKLSWVSTDSLNRIQENSKLLPKFVLVSVYTFLCCILYFLSKTIYI